MKKLWFLVSLVTCGILLTWCFKKVEQNPEIIDDCVTVDWEDSCAVDIDEPVDEEPTYEILEWTWYVTCLWWCENWSDEEYVEWYYYRYTNPKLWLRITTPSWQLWYYGEYFRVKQETPIFEQIDNGIYASELRKYPNVNTQEFIKVYEKDPSITLEDLLKQKYTNCKIDKMELWLWDIFHWFGKYFYDIESNRWIQEDNCIAREEWEWWSLVFYIESKNDNKYYKVWINDWCAPWPCSIFWKVETL